PYFAPAWPISSIGTSTMRLPSSTVNTACHGDMPWSISPAAIVYDGMHMTMPTQSAAKWYQRQVRCATGVGARSALYSAPWSISVIRFHLCVQMQIKRLNHREHGEHGESKKFMKTGEISNALDAVPIETSLPMDSLCFLRVLRVLRGSVFSSVSTVRQ